MSKKKGLAKASGEGMVLDCSIVMAWFFADESSDYADNVARQLSDQIAHVPSNWPLEVANTLIWANVENDRRRFKEQRSLRI